MGSRSSDSPLTSCSSLSIAPENWSPSLDSVSRTVLRSSISCSIDLVVVGQRVRERRRLGEQRFEGSALALQDLHQRCGERVDVLRIEALDNGFQAAEQQVEVQRGRRAVDGYLRAGRQDLRRSRGVDEFEVAVADQVEIADRSLGAVGQHDVCGRRRTSTSTLRSGCSDTSCTVPTRMPATRTVSPVFSRDASLKTAEYPFVEPVLIWPKMKNRKAVNSDHHDREDAELDERSAACASSGHSDLRGVARRSVDRPEQPLLEPVGVEQDALVAVLERVGADVGRR